MKILVEPTMRIQELSQSFQMLFTNLRLEIHDEGKEVCHFSHHTLAELANVREPSAFEITPEQTIRALEEEFMENLGFQITVFRKKDNNRWKNTAFSSESTLQQHQLGEV